MDELLGQELAELALPVAANNSRQRDFNLDPGLRRDDEHGLDADLRRDDEHGLDADLRWDDEHGLDADLRWDDGQGLDPGLRRDDEHGLMPTCVEVMSYTGVPAGVGTTCKATGLCPDFGVTYASDQARMKKPRGKAARFGVLREMCWISGRTAAC
ncbi:MAG TPA: hypothetical protein VF264_03300 [Rhodanobacteraceae bacterium]